MIGIIGEARLSTDQSLVKKLNRLGAPALGAPGTDGLRVDRVSREVELLR